MEFLSEILEWGPIPQDTLVYFRERLRHRLHSAILDAFNRRASQRDFKQTDLARRIHRTRAQIARWLSTQSNLTLDSISDLMVGLGMDFDEFPFTPIEQTIVTVEQERQQAGEQARLEKLQEKIVRDIRLELSKIAALVKEQELSVGGTSANELAPSPSAGTTASPTEQLQKPAPTNVIDLAAQAQIRSERIARERQRQLSNGISPYSGEAA
jgi:transcriptional regulator with XRE-family HTH domain